MRLMDRQYLATPFYESRRMAVWLTRLGYRVNQKRIERSCESWGCGPSIGAGRGLQLPARGRLPRGGRRGVLTRTIRGNLQGRSGTLSYLGLSTVQLSGSTSEQETH